MLGERRTAGLTSNNISDCRRQLHAPSAADNIDGERTTLKQPVTTAAIPVVGDAPAYSAGCCKRMYMYG